ncbi:MAG: GYD domain-containing protein [Alphaproteobacteria bacterium]
MATFITTGNYTSDSVRAMVSNPDNRMESVKQLVEASGGKLIHLYMTTGETDFLLITEADDGAVPVAAAMAAAASGSINNVKTIRAWTSAEFKSIAEKAGAVAASYAAPGQS